MNAIITGGTKGIGRAIAEKFASSGYDVMICSRHETELYTVLGEFQVKYPSITAKAIPADLSSKKGVQDYGKGIPHGEQKKVFEKFYRGGNEYTQASRGTGLGLFLTKRIVENHKGKIDYTENKPQGSIFRIRLHQI